MDGADIIALPLHVNESCVMKNDCATVELVAACPVHTSLWDLTK